MEKELQEKCEQLDSDQLEKDRLAIKLGQERDALLQQLGDTECTVPNEEVLTHYNYILPLVRDVHRLELQVKELEEKYEEQKLHIEATRIGKAILAASLDEKECVLKTWWHQLQSYNKSDDKSVKKNKGVSATNLTYQCDHERDVLIESLGFTVLCQGIHIHLQIESEVPCHIIHCIDITTAKVGLCSDTHIPGLEKKVLHHLSERLPVAPVVNFMADYIMEDIAPFCVIIPMKLKTKSLKGKSTKTPKEASAKTSPKHPTAKEEFETPTG